MSRFKKWIASLAVASIIPLVFSGCYGHFPIVRTLYKANGSLTVGGPLLLPRRSSAERTYVCSYTCLVSKQLSALGSRPPPPQAGWPGSPITSSVNTVRDQRIDTQ